VEIHPITKIEVFKGGKWVDLDNLLRERHLAGSSG